VAGAQEAFGATEFAFVLKGNSAGDLVREIIDK